MVFAKVYKIPWKKNQNIGTTRQERYKCITYMAIPQQNVHISQLTRTL